MVRKISFVILLCSIFIYQIIVETRVSFGAEQTSLLKYKAQAIKKDKDIPIGDLAISIVDVNNDKRNEIAISGNGYIRIFEWNGTSFDAKWSSPQFSHQLGPVTLYDISRLVTASYYSDNKFTTDNLIFAPTAAKASDIYKVTLKNNKYELQKTGTSPFNWFQSVGKCFDGSSVVIGKLSHQNGNYLAVYKWDGSELVEKWRGSYGADIKASGERLSSTKKLVSVFLVQDNEKIGILSCKNESIEWKEVGKEPNKIDLWSENRIGYGKSLIGFTKNGSAGELWSIQYPTSEAGYYGKLYVSQFDGKRFSPFSRMHFKGIDSNMIFNMIITDVDNDGVGEILGVEEKIRKTIPRNNLEDTGEEGDTLLITSNLFLAKWNGKEYEVKWYRKAIDEKVSNIAVGDVTGDGKNEILVTDDNGYLYVFDMPSDK